MIKEKIGQKTLVVMSLTLLSRLGGFVRDIILAQIFGATAVFDAFIIAFKLPNLTRRLFGEGAFSQALTPALAEYKTQHPPHQIKLLINQIAGVMTLVGVLVVILGEIMAPLGVLLFAPGFSHHPDQFSLTVRLVRITQPYLLIIGWISLAGAILNTYHRFALTAFTPVILNLVLIATAYFVAPAFGVKSVYALALALLLSGILQLIAQWPALRTLNLVPRPSLFGEIEPVKKLFRRVPSALLGVSAGQISLLIDNLFASFLPAGSISWLYYADRLIYLPLGVIGVAIATVTTPILAQLHQQKREQEFSHTLDWGLRNQMAAALPAAVGLLMLAGPIIATLLHHGVFTAQDVWRTRQSLMAFAVGLPAWMAIKIFASALYARLDTKTPAYCAGMALTLNIILNFILMKPLGHAGLALATALASWVNAMVLLIFLIKRKIYQPRRDWSRVMASILIATGLMSGFLWWVRGDLSQWLLWETGEKTWRLLAIISSAVFIYLIGLGLSGLRWRHFKPHDIDSRTIAA